LLNDPFYYFVDNTISALRLLLLIHYFYHLFYFLKASYLYMQTTSPFSGRFVEKKWKQPADLGTFTYKEKR
jgi:hypothetical protein